MAIRRILLPALILVAALAVGAFLLMGKSGDTFPYEGHDIPKDQLRVVDPHPGCEESHYHAASEDKQVTATDGTVIADDTDCGFGPAR